jgi:hypothetical protein
MFHDVQIHSVSLMGDGTNLGTTFVPRETLNVQRFVLKSYANTRTKVRIVFEFSVTLESSAKNSGASNALSF